MPLLTTRVPLDGRKLIAKFMREEDALGLVISPDHPLAVVRGKALLPPKSQHAMPPGDALVSTMHCEKA